MGCEPGVAGKIRSAGVFVVSIIFSTRTPGSIMCESAAPAPRLMMAAATINRLFLSKKPRIRVIAMAQVAKIFFIFSAAD